MVSPLSFVIVFGSIPILPALHLPACGIGGIAPRLSPFVLQRPNPLMDDTWTDRNVLARPSILFLI
jgi:hypothetical protein